MRSPKIFDKVKTLEDVTLVDFVVHIKTTMAHISPSIRNFLYFVRWGTIYDFGDPTLWFTPVVASQRPRIAS